MFLYFVRHASAGQKRPNAAKDEKRPLDKDGIEQCRQAGRVLAMLETQVDLVISSPLKRATQTAALVSNEIGYEGKFLMEDALRPEADFASFRALLTRQKNADALMLVGHNPSISQFASYLISGGESDAAIDLKKGAVAKVDVSQRRATLLWCITPRIVRAAQESATSSSQPNTSRK